MQKLEHMRQVADEELASHEKNFYTAIIDVMIESEMWKDASTVAEVAL